MGDELEFTQALEFPGGLNDAKTFELFVENLSGKVVAQLVVSVPAGKKIMIKQGDRLGVVNAGQNKENFELGSASGKRYTFFCYGPLGSGGKCARKSLMRESVKGPIALVNTSPPPPPKQNCGELKAEPINFETKSKLEPVDI